MIAWLGGALMALGIWVLIAALRLPSELPRLRHYRRMKSDWQRRAPW